MNHLTKSGILTLLAILIFLVGWELYWRSQGFEASHDDTDALWADKRAMVYEPASKATVFIGSSRIKFDLDIPTWEKATGDQAIQLAMVGSTPLPVLKDLADDENFKGKLVIDVTEPLFFSTAPPNMARPLKNIAYYKKRTPTQRFGFMVNRLFESNFVFLEQEYLSLNSLLDRLPLPKRQQIFNAPYFPAEFERTKFSRQSSMTQSFVEDANLQKQQQDNWLILIAASKQFPSLTQEDFNKMFASVKSDIDKIRKRGGEVLFVRTPSSGPMWIGEQKGFPRNQFWGKMVGLTKAESIHFTDYPETSEFICPEWSHLSPQDAKIYTIHLIRQIEAKGWNFPNKPNSEKRSLTLKH